MEPTLCITAAVADLDETVAGDPHHPALALIAETDFGLVRVVVPPFAWPLSRELLQVGRRVRLTCQPTLKSPPIATRIDLIDTLH